MTPAVLDRPGALFADAEGRAGAHAAPAQGGERLSLEALLSGALHETRTNGSTECPVCHARMTPARAGVHSGAGCGGCGSRLS